MKTRAATGPSCATAASTPTRPSPSAFSIPWHVVAGGRRCQVEMPAPIARKHAARTRLSHARRVGAARGHLACLAAQSRGLARQVSADSLALRRDCAPARGARASAPYRRGCQGRTARARHSEAGWRELEQVSFHHWPTDRVGRATPGPSSSETRKAGSASPTGASMPGPSTPTGISTTRFRAAWRSCSACPQWQPTVEFETGRHAPHGPRRRLHRRQRRTAFCSPPKSAC